MTEREHDMKFEHLLRQTMPELPPEDVVAEVTPWKKAMNRVLVGLLLTTLTLNFLNLNYILPAIGVALCLLGLRTLRKENGAFHLCYYIMIFRALALLAVLIANTTIYHAVLDHSPLGGVTAAAQLVFLLGFWRALCTVKTKASMAGTAPNALALVAWYAALIVLALFNYSGIIIIGALIVCYILIFRSLWKLSKELDEAGYAIRPAPVRVADRPLVIVMAAVVLGGCICGYAFGGHYTMEWTPVAENAQSGTEEIRAHLLELGFPEDFLNDLTEEDILACDGATEIYVQNDPACWSGSSADSIGELQFTGVAVRLSSNPQTIRLFQRFQWQGRQRFYGTEALQLWTASDEAWAVTSDVTGRLLYDNGDQIYTAPYASLGRKSYEYNSMFWGSRDRVDVFASFSLPSSGENCRGYLTYSVEAYEAVNNYLISSWLNYNHQRTWMQYPVQTAEEDILAFSWNEGAFSMSQSAIQFYPAEDGWEAE